MKTKIMLAVIAVATLFATTLTLFSRVRAAQANARTVYIKQKADQPIQITSVKAASRMVESGIAFEAGDDWLDGLEVTLKNTTDRDVTTVYVVLEVDINGKRHHKPSKWGITPGNDAPLKPGAEIKFLMPKGAASGLSEVTLLVSMVFFDNNPDRLWRNGKYLRRSPDDPDLFVVENGERAQAGSGLLFQNANPSKELEVTQPPFRVTA